MYSAKAPGTQGPFYGEISKLVACSRESSRQGDQRLVEVLRRLGHGCPGSGYGPSVVFGKDAKGGGGGGGGSERGIWEFRTVHGGLGRR